MTFTQAIQSGFKNYVNFTGRASREQFWYWFLFCFLGGGIASILDASTMHSSFTAPDAMHPLYSIFALITFVPNLAINVRRLHDLGRSGWWLLLILIPLLGFLLLLFWYCQKGDEGTNEYGANPQVEL